MSSPPYTIECITTEDGVCALQEDWDRLSRTVEQPNVFTTYDWFQAWYKDPASTQGSTKRRPNILVLKRDGAVTGISPFIYSASSRLGFILRKLQFVSRTDYSDLFLGDDVSGQAEAVVEFLSQSVKEWDLLDLRDLRDTGNEIALIKSAVEGAGLTYRLMREEERCPYMTIDGPWSHILDSHSTTTRRRFRNRQSRLDRLAGEGLRVRVIEEPHQQAGLLDKMVALEAQKHVDGRLSQPFLGLHAEVFASLFETLGPKGWLCVVAMELKDRLLASQLLFRCGGRLWGYLTAYDHEFSRLSPGSMLIPAAVDYAFSHGYTEFDFLSGEESYKMQWTTGFHHTYRLVVWNRRPMSRLRASVYLRLRARSTASSTVEYPAH